VRQAAAAGAFRLEMKTLPGMSGAVFCAVPKSAPITACAPPVPAKTGGSASLKAKKTCRYFASGKKCKDGDRCKFLHNKPPLSSLSNDVTYEVGNSELAEIGIFDRNCTSLLDSVGEVRLSHFKAKYDANYGYGAFDSHKDPSIGDDERAVRQAAAAGAFRLEMKTLPGMSGAVFCAVPKSAPITACAPPVPAKTGGSASLKAKKTCRYFASGKKCKDGDRCKFLHSKPTTSMAAARTVPDGNDVIHTILELLHVSSLTRRTMEKEQFDTQGLVLCDADDLRELCIPETDVRKLAAWIQSLA